MGGGWDDDGDGRRPSRVPCDSDDIGANDRGECGRRGEDPSGVIEDRLVVVIPSGSILLLVDEDESPSSSAIVIRFDDDRSSLSPSSPSPFVSIVSWMDLIRILLFVRVILVASVAEDVGGWSTGSFGRGIDIARQAGTEEGYGFEGGAASLERCGARGL